jgi:hypothetical protein
MSTLNGKMVLRDGYYWFAYAAPLFDKPEVVTSYWKCWPAPIGESSYDGAEAYLTRHAYGTAISFRTGERNWSRERGMGPERVADFTESAPLPCPKVRKGMETRYRNGRWEKYTAKGYVTA